MKTEKEIRHAKQLFERLQTPDCKCIDCSTWLALQRLLGWVIGDDPEEERRMEKIELMASEHGR